MSIKCSVNPVQTFANKMLISNPHSQVVVEFFVETLSKKDKAKDLVRGNSRTNKNEEIPIPVLVLVGIPQKCCSA